MALASQNLASWFFCFWLLEPSAALQVWFRPLFFKGTSARYDSSRRSKGYISNSPPPRPPRRKSLSSDFSSNEDPQSSALLFMGSFLFPDNLAFDNNNKTTCDEHVLPLSIRGGKSTIKWEGKYDGILKGAKTTLTSSLIYWTNAYYTVKELVASPFRFINSSIKRLSPKTREQMEKEEEENKIMRDLQTIVVSEISAPNATTLPKDVLFTAAHRSGLLGGTLRPDAVQECAKLIKQWYVKQGFVLNAMTGATLIPEKNAAVLSVQEPSVSNIPVGITFAKELVVDPETNQPMTYREYRQYHHRRKTNKHSILQRKDMNTTIVETTGRTRPFVLAKALRLQPGKDIRYILVLISLSMVYLMCLLSSSY